MSHRVYNFSAGPAALPLEVLQQAAAEMTDWRGSGMGVMEMSHRGAEFSEIHATALADLRDLLAIPPEFKILFMQGGAIAENAIVPLNLSQGKRVDCAITGAWSQKSYQEAARYCPATVVADSVNADGEYLSIPAPATWQVDAKSRYVHYCSNETIQGVEFQELVDLSALGSDAPAVIDASSHILSRPVDWSRVGVLYAGAQKNIGAAGLTIVVIREDLLGNALPACPTAFNFKVVAENDSMYNTPPTYAIYIAGLVFQWLKRQGGVAAIEQINIAKAKLLYDFIDASDLYQNRVAQDCRSRMNLPFFLQDAALNARFLSEAKAAQLLQLKGHKIVGGMRASIYNAMPLAGVQALVDFMRAFEQAVK